MKWSYAGLISLLCLMLAPSEATAQERIPLEGYEVTVTSRPHYITLPSGRHGVRRDLVVDIYQRGRRVAAITDNFLNGYGVLKDYGPQPGFDTPGELQSYWEEKDSIETYWEPMDGLILVNNIPDAALRQSLTTKWAALYQRIFADVSHRIGLTELTANGDERIAITEEAPRLRMNQKGRPIIKTEQ
ncbi:MAG: hypothetical protein HY694_15540 [Deltaproteobacteria bacterium]|nr:hypothetical protein [Deltaproteobacteria bacterium]